MSFKPTQKVCPGRSPWGAYAISSALTWSVWIAELDAQTALHAHPRVARVVMNAGLKNFLKKFKTNSPRIGVRVVGRRGNLCKSDLNWLKKPGQLKLTGDGGLNFIMRMLQNK